MDLTLAATIPLNAMTASQALDYLPLRPRDTLLVTGAAGAVGGYAVELARTRGVRIVTQGRPEDEEFLRGRASWFVSSDEEPSEAVRRFVREGVDGVLDAAALGAPALAAVRDGGIFVSVRGDVPPAPKRGIVVRLTAAGPEPTGLSYLSALSEVGVLTPRVAQIYHLVAGSRSLPAHSRCPTVPCQTREPDSQQPPSSLAPPPTHTSTCGRCGGACWLPDGYRRWFRNHPGLRWLPSVVP
jgi:hypothetical protein